MKKLPIILVALMLTAAACNKSSQNTASFYDSGTWELVTQQNVDVDGDGTTDNVLLLKTSKSIDVSGAEEPEFGAKVLVVSDNKKVFEFTPSDKQNQDDAFPLGFYRPDSGENRNFYVEDLTGDRVADIVIKPGISGASDWGQCTVVITYNRDTKQLQSVNDRDFCSSFNVGVMVRDISSNISGTEILRSEPTNGIIGGNKVVQAFNIEVWTWTGMGWWKYKTFRSSRVYEGGSSALEGDVSQIIPTFY